MLSDPEQAFILARAAESASLREHAIHARKTGLANARWIGAEALLRQNRSNVALRLVENALLIARSGSDHKLIADIQLTRGGIFGDQARVADALAAYQDAYRRFTMAGNGRGQAIALQSIGNLYLDGRDFKNADRYYRQSEEAFSGDAILNLTLYNNRATSLMQQKRFGEAENEYARGLELARAEGSVVFEARILGNIAKAQLEQGRLDLATNTLRKALQITDQPAGHSWRRQIAAIEGQLAFQRGDRVSARIWIEQAFSGLNLEETNTNFRDAHSVAYELYNGQDAGLALAHLQALRRLTDEGMQLAASTNTALMAARFDFANQELRIARLKAEELRASVVLERSRAQFERTLMLAVSIAGAILLTVMAIALVTIRRSRNQVRAANVELEATNVALAKALAAKTEFLATTSHEIRTPLNGILGMAQVMLADRALPPVQRERVEVVHGAGLTMRALVDDILDVAKMETGHLSIAPEPADLRATLEDVARMWDEQARSRGLAFRLDLIDAPRWIETDAGRVRQIVFNLLSNALKFTSKGEVALTVKATSDGKSFALSVRDTGIGIPPDKHAQIFESFKQADSTTTRQFGGTGLGLTICRNLARALGGDIAVESEEGAGSTFTVTLPLITVARPDVAEDVATNGGIALLAANPIERSMLKTLLVGNGLSVTLVEGVASAMAALSGANSCLLADAAAFGADDDARLASISDLSEVAADRGTIVYVLWKHPGAAMHAAMANMRGAILIEKPIAGPALIARLSDNGNSSGPLATEAA